MFAAARGEAVYTPRMGKAVDSLAPGLLLASPPLGDPNFDRTVVLLALHGDGGALGFVINRAAPLLVGELLSAVGHPEAAADVSPVLLGGPVQRQSGWILSVEPDLEPGVLGVVGVGERLRVLSSQEAFEALARDIAERAPGEGDPKQRTVLLGYSGWGPGQLESEIARGAWIPAPLDERVVLSVELGERWEHAYGTLGLSPAFGLSMRSVGDA